jgi:hypothetical protein
MPAQQITAAGRRTQIVFLSKISHGNAWFAGRKNFDANPLAWIGATCGSLTVKSDIRKLIQLESIYQITIFAHNKIIRERNKYAFMQPMVELRAGCSALMIPMQAVRSEPAKV